MCGITGLYQQRGDLQDPLRVRAMARSLAHRGPDDEGLLLFGLTEAGARAIPLEGDAPTPPGLAASVALGQRRLSIIDLSSAGHQPMGSEDGKVWVTFNGEIYNFPAIRTELETLGYRFRSRSDTEVLVHGYRAWGPDLVTRLNGMFAFAVLDARDAGEPVLFLARDRFGVKPLYYARHGDTFMFASEIKALLAAGHPAVLDLPAMDAYFTFLWAPEPMTLVRGVFKLPAAHWMRVTRSGVRTERYWRMEITSDDKHSERELTAQLRDLLLDAVARQTLADVPVAAFLSGGLDSSAVVAMMVRSGNPPAKVFTVGFSEADRRFSGFSDDLTYARQVARQFGLEQVESVLSPDMTDLLPKLIWHLDEPMADPAIIPAYLMCAAARPHTKVLLSGMGGDELFGGYRRHVAARLMQYYLGLPRFVRRSVVPALVGALPAASRNPLSPAFRRIKRFTRAMAGPDGQHYLSLASWTEAGQRTALYTQAVRGAMNGSHAWDTHLAVMEPVRHAPLLDQMLFGDMVQYLPSHNLNYTDKMSMAASVEVRVPLLENEVVDFMTRVPARFKVRGGVGKYLLRKSMEGVLPPEVISRSKAGLGMPIGAWLTRDLRPLVEDVLSPDRLRRRGLFEATEVRAWYHALASGREDTSLPLWALLTLEMWMDTFKVKVEV